MIQGVLIVSSILACRERRYSRLIISWCLGRAGNGVNNLPAEGVDGEGWVGGISGEGVGECDAWECELLMSHVLHAWVGTG